MRISNLRQPLATANAGYALIASLLILFLVTTMGITAMVTSQSEQRIVTNIGEEKLMFGFGEQGVDRVLSHLHYLEGGLYGSVEGAGLTTTNPVQVFNQVRDLYIFNIGGSPSQHPNFRMDAYLNPLDYEGAYDRGISRPIRISTAVKNTITNYQMGFRTEVRPTSVWDLAYFSQNHNPAERYTGNGCLNSDPSPQTWYNCQAAFLNTDQIIGDTYVRTASTNPDSTILFMRGGPQFSGRVMWRNIKDYDYGNTSLKNSPFQTKGGSETTSLPLARQGFLPQTKDISLFDIESLTSGASGNFRSSADIVLTKRAGYTWKIIFRNDIDTNNNGVYDPDRIASRLNRQTNNGVEDGDDPGVMLIYSVPISFPTDWTNDLKTYVAFYGDTMRRRHDMMTNNDFGGSDTSELWTPAISWASSVSGSVCYSTRVNSPTSPTKGPHNEEDIGGKSAVVGEQTFYYIFAPSLGSDRSTWSPGAGTCSGTSGGIIYVEGDVMVSGILDGKTTIVAAGDIILDHEVQYEEHPQIAMFSYGSPNAIDMLGLFATGNIVIPNHIQSSTFQDPEANFASFVRPAHTAESHQVPWGDDWSDPESVNLTDWEPTAKYDFVDVPGDDGNEEIHAVMVSFGRGACTFSGSTATCPDPTTAQIQDFQTGVYARPRTSNGAAWGGDPAPAISPLTQFQTNDSGRLSIWGAIIQDYSGRLSYDHEDSTCITGSGSTCIQMGHRMLLTYDPRLKYTMPPTPYHVNAARVLPYGRAAWEIVSWEKIDAGDIAANDNW
ncbi:MAG: hypothetical protein H6684_06090 [Deltaproteobacteria bacterium]|nr:hypothetical protein [Deltaproteobacteria bacterium]MCB9478767.1 hypothetical protein [Deltaproteobacteria bacterium]MCB9488283.1 hypothetical protein [Deltaproteobacteria bacterium]